MSGRYIVRVDYSPDMTQEQIDAQNAELLRTA